jgi:hypothetical protein
MGQVASAGDNAAMESFFALLQKNVLNLHRWSTRYELRLAIITWIERAYRRRRQPRLGRLTPIEFETIMTSRIAVDALAMAVARRGDGGGRCSARSATRTARGRDRRPTMIMSGARSRPSRRTSCG